MTKKIKSIHFVGIKGVGMTPLAIIAKEAGITVTGSDIADEFITDKALTKVGITPFVGFDPAHVEGADIVITTGAHGGYDNPEVIHAKEKKLALFTKGQAVGAYIDGTIFGKKYSGIAVAGTHGKTTTTAMIATILTHAGSDPSYIIGTGSVASLPLPGHFGKGKYFVAESDEYATEPVYDKTPQFLWQTPQIAVFTNIEHDHPDIYPTIDDVRSAFLSFAKKLPRNGTLIACGDDREIQKLLTEYTGHVITYGFHDKNDYVIKRTSVSEQHMFFWLEASGTDIGECMIKVTGDHNALNATAAVIASLEAGLTLPQIKKALPTFTGSRRRMEYIGATPGGALVYDDYAHHPTEIQKSLSSLRLQFPKKKIICVFQPHTYSRTKKLFAEFTQAFGSADQVLITEIYGSQRESVDTSVSGALLAEGVKNWHKDVVYIENATDVVEYLTKLGPKKDTLLVLMGAGDIYKIADSLHLIQ